MCGVVAIRAIFAIVVYPGSWKDVLNASLHLSCEYKMRGFGGDSSLSFWWSSYWCSWHFAWVHCIVYS